mgnify:CR=1 FL=1
MQIATKDRTAVSMVKEALDKAKRCKNYNIFVSLNEEAAIKRAEEIDAKIAKGEDAGRLAGVPYALKDNFLSREGATTASSKILEPFKSPITSTTVKKLEAEGAIMIGRTNMDSFAHGSSTENSYFGPTLNAYDETRVAGGSSGGSAVAVAKGIVQFATGTDTGGSIRQPACLTGIVGMKPTYGAVSRYGLIAYGSSLDQIGPMARTVDDTAMLFKAICGKDKMDATSKDFTYTPYGDSVKGMKLGLPKEYFGEGISAEVKEKMKDLYFKEGLSIQSDSLEIYVNDGVFNVKNISDQDINEVIYIYFKNFSNDSYFGGITYRVKINGIKKGMMSQVMSNHYHVDSSKVLFVTIGN